MDRHLCNDNYGNYIGSKFYQATIENDLQDMNRTYDGDAMEDGTEDFEDNFMTPYQNECYPSDYQAFGTSEKKKIFEMTEQKLPDTFYNVEYLAKMMDTTHVIRNICIVGELHTGKTTLVDCFIKKTHPKFARKIFEHNLRYTDTLLMEQERGLSIKATPVTLVLPGMNGKSYLMNIFDTPGHVNFFDEVTAAMRMCDGVVILVDASVGIKPYTLKLIKLATEEKLAITLCINKIDRFILELRYSPEETYDKISNIIEEVNGLVSLYSGIGQRKLLSPPLGNVCFASSEYNICFTLRSFAYRHSGAYDFKDSAALLWGNIYFNSKQNIFTEKAPRINAKLSFVEFILEPIYKIFGQTVEDVTLTLPQVLYKLGIRLTKEEKMMNIRPLLQLIFLKHFGGLGGFVDMCVDYIPAPCTNAKNKVDHTYTGAKDTKLFQDMLNCNAKGFLMVHTTKMYPSEDCTSFHVYGRVMSGTLYVGQQVRILNENKRDSTILTVGRLWINEARYKLEVYNVPAGNWVLIEGIDQAIVKTSTITDIKKNEGISIFQPPKFDTRSIVKIGIKPVNPYELPRMLDGLRKVVKSYPILTATKVNELGLHVLAGNGELYLDCVMHDLQNLYSGIDIKVVDLNKLADKTVVDISSLRCSVKMPIKRIRKRQDGIHQTEQDFNLLAAMSVWGICLLIVVVLTFWVIRLPPKGYESTPLSRSI